MKKPDEMKLVVRGGKLPYWEKPRSVREAMARINRATMDVAKTIEDFVYRMGLWFIFVKDHLPHGEFERWVPENTRFKVRTARNFMTYATECQIGGQMKPYHPNPGYGKPATVAVLETPESAEVAEKAERPKSPKHEPEMAMVWSATECARVLLQRFETLTSRRTAEDCEEVRAAFDEMARDFIEEKAESRTRIMGHNDE